MKKLSIVDALGVGAESVAESAQEPSLRGASASEQRSNLKKMSKQNPKEIASSLATPKTRNDGEESSLRAVSEANGVAINSIKQRRHKKTPLENPQVDCHDPLRGSRNDDSTSSTREFAARNDGAGGDFNIESRQISPTATKNDESSDISLRPSSWDGYIGQDKIKKNLRVFIEAAKSRGECLDHILFFGPPGLGKTTLSYIIANAMGANIKVIAAPMIEKSGDLAALLTNLSAGDIFFIDEIHRMSPAIEEVLYPAMEDFRLDITIGSGPAAQTLKIDLPRFTLVGATTRAGMLSNPLRERFGISFNMSFYTHEELALIIKNAAAKLGREIESSAAQEIAKRSRGTPRIALRLLKRVRDFADVASRESSVDSADSAGAINLEIAKFALGELGINDLGFDELDIRYLKILTAARRRPLGLNTIAAAMSEDEGTIEDVIEPYLLANGYMERTAKGRVATALAYEVVGEKFQKDSLF